MTLLHAVVVVIPKTRGGDEVAVFRRSRRPGVAFPGQLCFPGGKVEPGETTSQAACREAQEEVGLLVGASLPFASIVLAPPLVDSPVRLTYHVVHQYIGTIKATEPGTEACWMTLDALSRSVLITPGTHVFLDILDALVRRGVVVL